MKILLMMFLFLSVSFAHPVSYTIELKVVFNKQTKELNVQCQSDSRNKCGLHNFHLLNKNEHILTTARFPFMKSKTSLKVNKKPAKLVFFLRKVPEHIYTVLIE